MGSSKLWHDTQPPNGNMTSSMSMAAMWAAASCSMTHNHDMMSSAAAVVAWAAANHSTTCNYPMAT